MIHIALILALLLVAWKIVRIILGERRHSHRAIHGASAPSNFGKNSLTKGEMGEFAVETILSCLPEDRFLCFHDIMLNNGCFTTQIDHIVVTRSSILVIETKNYSGELYGGENSQYWTHVVKHYTKWGRVSRSDRYQIYNPVLQNKRHCEVVEKYIWDLMGDVAIVPVLCVSETCELNLQIMESNVVMANQLLEFVKKYDYDAFGQERQEQLARRIVSNNIKDPLAREQHIENAQRAAQDTYIKESQNICPRCGGTLVLRNGKYGQFWGCSRYPNCKYMRK